MGLQTMSSIGNMVLWRVDVAGVSHRIVEAESKDEAVVAVGAAILDALNLKAAAVDASTERYYAGLSRNRKRTFIASVDGLASPRVRSSRRAARRRLAAWIKYDIQEREWLAAATSAKRPVDPEAAARFIRSVEIERVERLRSRHQEFDREPRIYPDRTDDAGYAAE